MHVWAVHDTGTITSWQWMQLLITVYYSISTLRGIDCSSLHTVRERNHNYNFINIGISQWQYYLSVHVHEKHWSYFSGRWYLRTIHTLSTALKHLHSVQKERHLCMERVYRQNWNCYLLTRLLSMTSLTHIRVHEKAWWYFCGSFAGSILARF